MHVEDLRILSDCARTTLPFSGYSFMELMFQVLQILTTMEVVERAALGAISLSIFRLPSPHPLEPPVQSLPDPTETPTIF